MRLTEGYISLRKVRLHAFHGVLPQERLVGGDFIVDVRVGCPLEKAMQSDNVEDTLNYASLYELVRREMQKPSQLLEHVVGRIAQAIEESYPLVTSVDVRLTKVNPPMGADSEGATVEGRFVK